LVLPLLSQLLLGFHLYARILATILILAPIGFVMGMPFPLGIRLAAKTNQKLIPWAWCANGCSSVLSSIGALMIAISFSFSTVFLLAIVVYFCAFIIIVNKLG
jgi:hypothetical protein